MDDATDEHYSMFFAEEEGTESCFRWVKEVIEKQGLFRGRSIGVYSWLKFLKRRCASLRDDSATVGVQCKRLSQIKVPHGTSRSNPLSP